MTGLDTETHKGKVVLIATPKDCLELWRYRQSIQWDILREWLTSHDDMFCCWNADYDVQACLKLLPKISNEWLWRETRSQFGRYRLRFVPSKFFTINYKNKVVVRVYDLMQFYACSLEIASQKVLGRGKTSPNVAWTDLLKTLQMGRQAAEEIKSYCKNDATLVQEIYDHSKEAMELAGVDFDKPISCASIAVQKFRRAMTHHVPRIVNNAFEKTYRGGRIETLKRGYFAEAWLTDLHSAYPSVMSELKTTDGHWLQITETEPLRADCRYAAIRCEVSIPKGEYRCPVAVLGETQLIYPTGRWSTWLDLDSFRLLQTKGWISKVFTGWQLLPTSDSKPFKELATMYDDRQRFPALNWALKIIMNSLYGKVAQRISRWTRTHIIDKNVDFWKGEVWRKKEQWARSTNFVYASAITSRIRNRLYGDIKPQTSICYATDGVLHSVSPDLNCGSKFGQWSIPEPVRDLVVVGSGVYSYKQADGQTVTKVRGYEVGLDLIRLLDHNRRILTLTVKRNWSLAQSVRLDRYDMLNEIVEVPRFLDCAFDKKRIWEDGATTGKRLLAGNVDSRPWEYETPTRYRDD